jgi:predicted RNA binding protein YcfA (HicA-like mRNA interferase family)
LNRDEKIIRKMKQSPRNVRFEELDGFLKRQGFDSRQRGTSHVVYKRPGTRLTVARPHGGKKTIDPAAIDEVLERLEL